MINEKVLFFIAFAISGNMLFAQSLDDVKKFIDKNDYAGAKTAIDKYMADSKNAAKADGWFYKGVIYNEVSKKDETKNLCTNCKWEAFEALKKYQQLDAKNVYMVLENNVRLFDLYNGFFDQAAKLYNAKDYMAAYESFKSASSIEDYIKQKGYEYNGFKFSAVDTSLIQNTALAARLAERHDLALPYYQKLADINLQGPDHLEMYQYLAEKYLAAKNKTAYDAIISKAKSFYPADPYWIDLEIDQIDKKDKVALFAKYEELLPKNPNNYALAYNYAVELFNYNYVGDPRPADYEANKPKIATAIKNAIAIKGSADANLLMARSLYNNVYDMQETIAKIKGTKPADIKAKADQKALITKGADECIKYADAAASEFAKLTTYKAREKADYKNALSIMEDMYNFKGNAAKALEYKKRAEFLK
ncbi:MAG: hypothetical protein IPP48_12805 [Chitinophagaceae bacterium]|nr:hypothetical protein [Chitinophagaceae bacterium]